MVEHIAGEAGINAQLVEQRLCRIRISPRRLDIFGASKIDQCAAPEFLLEGIALELSSCVAVDANTSGPRQQCTHLAGDVLLLDDHRAAQAKWTEGFEQIDAVKLGDQGSDLVDVSAAQLGGRPQHSITANGIVCRSSRLLIG